MIKHVDLIENFKFLTLEIRKQLEETVKLLEDPENFSLSRLKNSGDYADNLRNIITRKSYKRIIDATANEKHMIDSMMALNTTASNLERIGDFCENIVKQVDHFTDPTFIRRFDYNAYFRAIFAAVDVIVDALFEEDIKKALAVAGAEVQLDDLYKHDLDLILPELKQDKENTQDLLTSLFIFRYLERIGDSLLNIGEAIISANVGTKLKISQYISLREALEDDDFTMQKIGGETRSGCIIEKVVTNQTIPGWDEVIFKEGKYPKLEEERVKLDHWQQIMPGLTPRVLEFKRRGENALILMEFLHGLNFQEILIGSDPALLVTATGRVLDTVNQVWEKTLIQRPVSARFIPQLNKRLRDILAVHPEFRSERKKIGSVAHRNLETLLRRAETLEKQMPAPFSVMIHGDFNNDNIIYDPGPDRVRYIDLHRSSNTDYVQDVSVFLISNFRMPIFENGLRERINQTNVLFYEFAREFAAAHGDTTFEVRLTLGLVRSFITSTRFILNDTFAKDMFNRAVYLLHKLLSCNGEDTKEYHVGKDVLCY